jgi:hypothetical protein
MAVSLIAVPLVSYLTKKRKLSDTEEIFSCLDEE